MAMGTFSALAAILTIAGCGGTGNGTLPIVSSPINRLVGTWKGNSTKTRSHGGPAHLWDLQFQRSGGQDTTTFFGTVVMSQPGTPTSLPLYSGTFNGSFTASTGRVQMDMFFSFDPGGNPVPAEQGQVWTFDLTENNGVQTGSYDVRFGGTSIEGGTASFTRLTTADHPNTTVTGNWTGIPPTGGIQLFRPNPFDPNAEDPLVLNGVTVPVLPVGLVYSNQDDHDNVTATVQVINPQPPFQPVNVTVHGVVVGDIVLVSGVLPNTIGPLSVPIGGSTVVIPMAGRAFLYTAVVSPSGSQVVQNGHFFLKVNLLSPNDLQTGSFYKLGSFQVAKIQ